MRLQVKNLSVSATLTLTFTVSLQKQNITSMTLVSAIPSPQRYRAGQGVLLVDPPVYSPVPSNGYMTLSYTIVTGSPSFVTIQAGPPAMVKILTLSYSNVGTYTVSVKTTDTTTSINQTTQFSLIVYCLSSLTPVTHADVVYYIGDPV